MGDIIKINDFPIKFKPDIKIVYVSRSKEKDKEGLYEYSYSAYWKNYQIWREDIKAKNFQDFKKSLESKTGNMIWSLMQQYF